MNRKYLILSFVLAASSLLPAAEPAKSTAAKPNIIVILADDMGYSDLGCFGSEIKTPNLDKLAANGMRFTEFYNMSRCCPSRAAILTGLYPHQAGVGLMQENQGLPAYQGHLNDNCVTLAEVLKSAGYATAICGKWHVGGFDFHPSPWMRGFDHGISSIQGGFYYAVQNKQGQPPPLKSFWLDGKQLPNDSPALPKDWYTTDVWTDYGIKYINDAVAEKKPFFLYLAYNAPHFPLQAPAADIAKYRGKYLAGWDKLREQRYQWQLAHGIIDPSWPLSPLPKSQPDLQDVVPWDSLNENQKDRFDHLMSIYAACVDHMDQAVGRLVENLKKQGVLDNTLILFLSDNGGNLEGGPNGTSIKRTGELGSSDSTVFCGESWATLENTPFRYYKHFEHEGGISSAFIAHWPNVIKTHGSLSKERAQIIDIMATCVDVSGAKYPDVYHGNKILPMEGKSILPAFTGGKLAAYPIFREHEENEAVLDGDWKLVRPHGAPWELYNITKDRTELNNLAALEPDRVKELSAKWEAWALRTGALPKPTAAQNQNRRPARKNPEANSEN
jgi:arylsulfatase A-like enzyme